MARVKIQDVVEHLSSQIRRSLEEAVEEVTPGTDIDAYELFRAFRRAVGRKCSTWEHVPDQYVET